MASFLGKGNGDMRALVQVSTLGMTFALGVALFTAVGWWMDNKLHTTPVCMLVLALVGLAASLTKFVRDVRSLDDDERNNSGGAKDGGQ